MQASYRSFAAVALATALASGSALAQTKHVCDGEHQTRVQASACAKAAESPTALRQYAWNTRMIHNLAPTDYLRTREQAAQRTADRKGEEAPWPVAAAR